MATLNPFDLLVDDDAEDPSQLIAAAQKAAVTKAKAAPPSKAPAAQEKPSAKLPSKPLPPAEAMREARGDFGRGGGRGGGRGFGRGRGGGGRGRRDFGNDENTSGHVAAPGGQGAPEDGETGGSLERRGSGGPRPYRGGRRGGVSNGEAGEERPRRHFERHSGTGRGFEMKREGAGRGNWGTQTDEIAEVTEEIVTDGKNVGDVKPAGEEAEDGAKESPKEEEKEPEDKEMTLEEYEKLLEEKRKDLALLAFKTAEQRKVDAKAFESMQQISKKKDNDEIFVKLGSDKDKKKEAAEKEEKAKKSLSINEFLKPAEGEKYYNPGGRGRGRGRGPRGGYSGGSGISNVPAPKIEDPSHFPTLGAK